MTMDADDSVDGWQSMRMTVYNYSNVIRADDIQIATGWPWMRMTVYADDKNYLWRLTAENDGACMTDFHQDRVGPLSEIMS